MRVELLHSYGIYYVCNLCCIIFIIQWKKLLLLLFRFVKVQVMCNLYVYYMYIWLLTTWHDCYSLQIFSFTTNNSAFEEYISTY